MNDSVLRSHLELSEAVAFAHTRFGPEQGERDEILRIIEDTDDYPAPPVPASCMALCNCYGAL